MSKNRHNSFWRKMIYQKTDIKHNAHYSLLSLFLSLFAQIFILRVFLNANASPTAGFYNQGNHAATVERCAGNDHIT